VKTLGIILVLLLVSIAGMGLYRGWGSLSANDTDSKSSATITLDKDQIRKDEQTVKRELQDIGHTAKETTGDRADKVRK
jgi:hypothetical protein